MHVLQLKIYFCIAGWGLFTPGEYMTRRSRLPVRRETTTTKRVSTPTRSMPAACCADTPLGHNHHIRDNFCIQERLWDPRAQIGSTPFHLAHQGGPDLQLMVSLASVYNAAAPSLRFTAPHCDKEKTRVGEAAFHLEQRPHRIGEVAISRSRSRWIGAWAGNPLSAAKKTFSPACVWCAIVYVFVDLSSPTLLAKTKSVTRHLRVVSCAPWLSSTPLVDTLQRRRLCSAHSDCRVGPTLDFRQ